MVTISLDRPGGSTIVPRHEPAPARATALPPVALAASRPGVAVDPPPPTAAVAGAGAGAMVGGCALAHDVGEAIAQDPLAIAELDALPSDVRSSADAVMLWNGQWLDTGPVSIGAAGSAIRRLVETVVGGAAPDCREAPVSGPQFLPVPEPGRTVMIVIGSGSWRWEDLLPAAPDCADPQAGSCAPAPAAVRQP